MTPPPPADFFAGDDVPDPVARLLAYDYYDGPVEGVFETHAGRSYHFEMIDDWPGATADTVRMFFLSQLPAGSFTRLVALISPHCDYREPFWMPSWWHLPYAQKAALDRNVDAVLDSARGPEWVVAGHFVSGHALRVRAGPWTAEELAHLNGDPARWAALFGLAPRAG